MSGRYEMVTLRQIYDHDAERRGALTVGPDKDSLGLIEIDGGTDYGRLVVNVELAKLVYAALGKCIVELDR